MVLLDVMMPDMAGEEVLERMRALDPDVPVILTSGYVPGQAAGTLSHQGATAFLAKLLLAEGPDGDGRAGGAGSGSDIGAVRSQEPQVLLRRA